jgi:beta-glucanase (GH16 family)
MSRFGAGATVIALAVFFCAGLPGCGTTEPLADPPSADKAVPPSPADTRPTTSPASADRPGWKLTWSDEFDGPDGSQADPAKWTYDIGGDGWGNHEFEYYTHDLTNSVIKDGKLYLIATDRDTRKYYAWYGRAMFTSARITTRGKFSQKYGRFEARIKVPQGLGMWPAFWMLGADYPQVEWPQCGEIDIMENIGDEPSVVHGTLHAPGRGIYMDEGFGGDYTLPNAKALADHFHVYAVEWEPSVFRFYFDDILYKTITRLNVPNRSQWVWDHPFFILLNLAVGGDWPLPPDFTTRFPKSMAVDYVRVYSKQ